MIKKILIYGDIDLNLIDGSSIWITSLMNVLTQDPHIELTLLLKTPIIRSLLLEPFSVNNKICIIDPWKHFCSNSSNESWHRKKRLKAEEALLLIEKLNNKMFFDIIISRGFNLSYGISQIKEISSKTWAYITDFPQEKNQITEKEYNQLKSISENVKYIVCQTEEIKNYYKKILKTTENRFILLPPMIPNYPLNPPSFKNTNKSLIYVGKFASHWYTKEMVDAFVKIKRKDKNMKFHIAGDKFNIDPHNHQFRDEMINKLEHTAGVIWHKGISRDAVEKLINKCGLGISWRHPKLDNSLELSTKLLEYGRLGKPVLLNRNKLHEKLLGKDYPLYANSEEEFIKKINILFSNKDVYEKASKNLYEACKRFTYGEVYKQLSPYLWDTAITKEKYEKQNIKKIKLLFAGHDFKFAKILMDYFMELKDYDIKIDQWKGHNNHDEEHSFRCLKWANVIICEWGLGNAVWYSNHKRKEQILIVRMHRQEMDTNYPEQFNMENINKIIAISPHITRAFKEKFAFLKDKLIMVPNIIDYTKLNQEKLNESKYHLGLVGYCPHIKRLDRALDIFEILWEKDKKYKLFIKGKSPNEYPWLWKKDHEREYYQGVFKRIEQSPWRNAVVFEPWSMDITNWFRKIGFILSVSDYESFHLAAAEGMASGSIPVILRREGAAELYPKEFIFQTSKEAAAYIDASIKNNNMKSIGDYVKKFIRNRYDKEIICDRWKSMIEEGGEMNY